MECKTCDCGCHDLASGSNCKVKCKTRLSVSRQSGSYCNFFSQLSCQPWVRNLVWSHLSSNKNPLSLVWPCRKTTNHLRIAITKKTLEIKFAKFALIPLWLIIPKKSPTGRVKVDRTDINSTHQINLHIPMQSYIVFCYVWAAKKTIKFGNKIRSICIGNLTRMASFVMSYRRKSQPKTKRHSGQQGHTQ